MHRIDSANAVADRFGSGKDGFTNGDPDKTNATETTDDWMDGVQEELAAPIESMGLTLVSGTTGQLFEALQKRLHRVALANWETITSGGLGAALHGGASNDDGDIILVGDDVGGDASIMRSVDDGKTFSHIAPAAAVAVHLNDVTHDQTSLWVAVGDKNGGEAYLLSSTDGTTWTRRNVDAARNSNLYSVAHNGTDLWVAVGENDGTDAYVLTSANGTTGWTAVAPTVPKGFDLNAICYGNGMFVAVGEADGTDAYIVTSSDGVTWTEQANPKNFDLEGVTYGNGLFVAVGKADGTDAYIITSPDGVTWTERTNAENRNLLAVHYDTAFDWFFAGGAQGVDPDGFAYALISPDGLTWEKVSVAENVAIYGITSNGKRWAFCGGPSAAAEGWIARTALESIDL